MNKSKLPVAQKEVLGMLIDDHRMVAKIFKDFESEKDPKRQEEMVTTACNALTVHAEIEEQVFYPFLREQDPEEFGDLLNEAKVEHASAKDLIAQLSVMKPGDELYEAKFTVLGEYVDHHVKEEEDELFPKIINKKIDLRELLDPMMTQRQKLEKMATPA